MTVNKVGNDLNGANTSDVQVQFLGDPARKKHQNILSVQRNDIRHEEVPVLASMTEPSIGTNNQPDLTISTGVVHVLHALKRPVTEEVIADTTAYNTGANRTPRRVSRNGIDITNPSPSRSGSSSVSSCSLNKPYGCVWKRSNGNIRKTTNLNSGKTSELNATIDITSTDNSILTSISIQIIGD